MQARRTRRSRSQSFGTSAHIQSQHRNGAATEVATPSFTSWFGPFGPNVSALAYAWMRVPERPAMASAAFSSEPMMQVRPARDSANLTAALTFGSMEPLPNWPSAM